MLSSNLNFQTIILILYFRLFFQNFGLGSDNFFFKFWVGSVVGPQQQFLCSKEAVLRRAGDAARRPPSPTFDSFGASVDAPPLPPPLCEHAGLSAVERYIREVGAHVDGRIQAVQARIEAMQNNGHIPPLSPTQGTADNAGIAGGTVDDTTSAESEARRRRMYGLVRLMRTAGHQLRLSGGPSRAQSL